MKISKDTSMDLVIEEAAKSATGIAVLYNFDKDNYCLWGKVLSLVGVPNSLLSGTHDLNNVVEKNGLQMSGVPYLTQMFDIRSCIGSREWDNGLEFLAIVKAQEAVRNLDVSTFRGLLKTLGIKLKGRK